MRRRGKTRGSGARVEGACVDRMLVHLCAPIPWTRAIRDCIPSTYIVDLSRCSRSVFLPWLHTFTWKGMVLSCTVVHQMLCGSHLAHLCAFLHFLEHSRLEVRLLGVPQGVSVCGAVGRKCPAVSTPHGLLINPHNGVAACLRRTSIYLVV